MKYICDAPNGKTWFRIETEAEATAESALMRHAVDKHFRKAREVALQNYQPTSSVYIEREIGLKSHLQSAMPIFLTLRDGDGNGLATAMLPPGGREDGDFHVIIVGPGNSDPYPGEGDAIEALGAHFAITLDRERCYPYYRV
ncbi:MAG TPA: hypothetical protein VEU47_05660 [Candidatus Cybelea sp.]|nr:hypothetical protein [Candidatus Cybelea sp.]